MHNSEITFHIYCICASNYLWSFGDESDSSILFETKHEYLETGTYVVQLNITSDKGCKDSILVPIVIYPIVSIFSLSAFTPNKQDGTNDTFFMKQFGIINDDSFEFMIFDKWGNKIFYTKKN